MFDLQKITDQIRQLSYAAIPFAVTRPEFQKIIDVFMEFLTLPLEIKEPMYFQLDPGNRGSEVGYKKYLRDLGHTDNREYFHYNEHAEIRFVQPRAHHPELDRLLTTVKPLYEKAKAAMEQVLLAFETHFPGIRDQFLPKNQIPDFYLRLLKYDRLNPGDFLAKGHYDRGGCTLALAESAPGLRMGPNDKQVKEVAHAEGQALFMPGIKFHSVTSDDYPPTWHDVVQKSENMYNENVARWAIVLFAGTFAMRNVTYAEAHTPQYT